MIPRSHGADANLAAHVVFTTDSAGREPFDEPRSHWPTTFWTFAAVLLGGMAVAWWLA